MPSTPIRVDAHGYLRDARAAVLTQLEGLDEYEVRRPRTATGTNLLGVVKHLIGIEAGYLGVCLGRPMPTQLPWVESDEPNADMWATTEESRAYIIGLYRQAARHADAVLAELGPDHPAQVPWWPENSRQTTASALVVRVLKDAAIHAGQLQILRELTDGSAGTDRDELPDDWWTTYVDRVESVAQQFRNDVGSSPCAEQNLDGPD